MRRITTKPETIDDYLALVSADKRAALEVLRQTIRSVAPLAEECISYQIPSFRQNGMLVGFGAAEKHCAFYLLSNTTTAAFQKELQKYDTSKGTIRFAADSPLPATLVKKLVKARLAENEAKKPSTSKSKTKTASKNAKSSASLKEVLAWLKKEGTKHDLDNLPRFGITAKNALGVSMAKMQRYAKTLGKNHALALDLWKSGYYEARMLATLLAEPKELTSAQMDQWCRDFDNWAICDTACFHLFDRSPHAWKKISAWSKKSDEFVKRAAFALLASIALHDKQGPDEPFAESLALIEQAATDDRNFVKKGVNWSLRAIGGRSPALQSLATSLAEKLAASSDATSRWIGKDALRQWTKRANLKKAPKKGAKKG